MQTRATVDYGAMAVAVPTKIMHGLGLNGRDLMQCKTKLKGAGGTDLGTIGAFVLDMSTVTLKGVPVTSKLLA